MSDEEREMQNGMHELLVYDTDEIEDEDEDDFDDEEDEEDE